MTLLPEDEAVAVLDEAVREALGRIYREVMAMGSKITSADAAYVTSRVSNLMRFVDDEAGRVMTGKFGALLEEVASIAQADMGVAGVFGEINQDQLLMALYNTQVHIKDLLESSVKNVNVIVTNAIVTGKSQKEIAQALYDELNSGEGMDVTMARAEMIARNEVFSVYRQTSKAMADEFGYKQFKMVGPHDLRNAPVCEENVGKVKTQEEWEDIEPLAFVYGLHVNCRHTFVPVRGDEE